MASLISQGLSKLRGMGTQSTDPSSKATTLGIPTRNTVNNNDLTSTPVILNLEDRWAGTSPPPQKATL